MAASCGLVQVSVPIPALWHTPCPLCAVPSPTCAWLQAVSIQIEGREALGTRGELHGPGSSPLLSSLYWLSGSGQEPEPPAALAWKGSFYTPEMSFPCIGGWG